MANATASLKYNGKTIVSICSLFVSDGIVRGVNVTLDDVMKKATGPLKCQRA